MTKFKVGIQKTCTVIHYKEFIIEAETKRDAENEVLSRIKSSCLGEELRVNQNKTEDYDTFAAFAQPFDEDEDNSDCLVLESELPIKNNVTPTENKK